MRAASADTSAATRGQVTVLICTRGRPENVTRAVASVLASVGVTLEVVVIDQNDDGESEERLRELADPRLRHLRSCSRGKCAALNEGIRAASSEVVVITDDDCEAPPDWVAGISRALLSRPDVGVAFSNVVASPHDASLGYVPTYEQASGRTLRSVASLCRGHALGAAMAVRKSVVEDMGGFDEAFGPGAHFPSCDDWDTECRALLKGWLVEETTEVAIVHDGFRTFAAGKAHAARDWMAIGAVCAKLVRVGGPAGCLLTACVFWADALLPPIWDVLRLRRPRGIGRVRAFIEGFVAGVRTPIDRATLRFKPQ